MFEILNEPNRKMDAEWNSLLAEALAVIRKTNPTRNVIIGPAVLEQHLASARSSSCRTSDRHIIVTVHYYEPHPFTHQGASWATRSDETFGHPLGHARRSREARRRTSTTPRPGRSRTTARSC